MKDSVPAAPSQPAPVKDRCILLAKKSNVQIPPQIMAQSKIRMPLQFFPNQNPPSINRKLGTGLTISLNERGIRCISRSYKEEDCARAQWVPWVNVSSNKFVEPIGPSLVAVAAPGNFFRVFIIKLEYNITKKKIQEVS